jgi:pilus biogenesis lipoprotein CpaD
MTVRTPADRNRAFRMAGALVGIAVALGACTHTGDEVTTSSIPDDYRQRHPIVVEETNRSVVIFVGQARGGLSASQRADVMGLAETWLREGTGAIVVDVPTDTPNAAAATDAFREVQSLVAAAGVPPRGIVVHRYHPENPRQLATIRLNYPKISAPRSRTRAISKTSSTTISAAPISATWRRWSTIRRTSCSHDPRHRPIPRDEPKLSRSIARVPPPPRSIRNPTGPN